MLPFLRGSSLEDQVPAMPAASKPKLLPSSPAAKRFATPRTLCDCGDTLVYKRDMPAILYSFDGSEDVIHESWVCPHRNCRQHHSYNFTQDQTFGPDVSTWRPEMPFGMQMSSLCKVCLSIVIRVQQHQYSDSPEHLVQKVCNRGLGAREAPKTDKPEAKPLGPASSSLL